MCSDSGPEAMRPPLFNLRRTIWSLVTTPCVCAAVKLLVGLTHSQDSVTRIHGTVMTVMTAKSTINSRMAGGQRRATAVARARALRWLRAAQAAFISPEQVD